MRYQPALVAVTSLLGLAAQSAAFLLTPEIAAKAEEAKAAWKAVTAGKSYTVGLQCNECSFYVIDKVDGEDVALPIPNEESKIQLVFDTTTEGLRVNNATIYPIDAVDKKFPFVKAHQLGTHSGLVTEDYPLDFAVEIRQVETQRSHHRGKFGRVFHESEEDDVTTSIVDFTILTYQGANIKTETVEIVLQHNKFTGTDDYGISNVNLIPFASTPGAQECQSQSNWSLCRIRAMVAARLRQMLAEAQARGAAMKEWVKTHAGKKGPGCNKNKHGKGKAEHKEGGRPHHHPNGGPHHKGPHHNKHPGHHPHHHVSAMMRTYWRTFVGIMMAFLSVWIASWTVIFAGIIFGKLIVNMWMLFVRGGRSQCGNEDVRVIEIEIEDGEKDGLLVAEVVEEEPPQYQDVEVKEVENEKTDATEQV